MSELMILVISLVAGFLVIAIIVALARWLFRINEIVESLGTIVQRLETILELAKRQSPAK